MSLFSSLSERLRQRRQISRLLQMDDRLLLDVGWRRFDLERRELRRRD